MQTFYEARAFELRRVSVPALLETASRLTHFFYLSSQDLNFLVEAVLQQHLQVADDGGGQDLDGGAVRQSDPPEDEAEGGDGVQELAAVVPAPVLTTHEVGLQHRNQVPSIFCPIQRSFKSLGNQG